MSEDLAAEIAARIDEHADDVERLRAGDSTALEDLLEACTGAKVSAVTIRSLV